VVKDFHPISIEQKSWQVLVAGVVISFEIICCLVAIMTKSHFMLLLGIGGAVGFALLFFNRQFREKYLGYQGDSSQVVASPTKFNNTQPKIEQSLLLWAMVILLAITAFIGLDLATHTAFSFLAIPFGIAGSLWSYRRRHLSKHPITYLVSGLAIALILACLGSAFWGQTIEKAKNFLGSDRDLVLPLATSFLLVAVQVAWMWSLCYPRRLASSVIISTMLMVSTVLIGNSFGFLLVLALFVGLLVPTLMLLYRSKINLKPIGLSIVPRPQQLTERHVPWKYLTKIAVASVILGCTLSLFAPQLRLPDISWDLPGVDQIVKNLPIQTDPKLPDSTLKDLAAMEGITEDEAAGKRNTRTSPSKGNFGGSGRSAGQSGGDDQFGGKTGQPNSGPGAESQQSDDNDSEFMDERLARQAIWNILATADRPLKTRAEREAYIQKYLQEHIQSPDCGPNNTYCFNSSLGNNLKSDRFTDQHQTSSARWNPAAQILLRPYYVAQQQIPPPLLRQLTTPCPVNQKDCYKNRVFQANKQESIRTHKRLLKSISGIDLTEDNPDNQSNSQGSGSSGSSGRQGGNQGSGSSDNSGGQIRFPWNNADRQSTDRGSGSSDSSGGQSGNQSFRFPWSSPDGKGTNKSSGSAGGDSNRQNGSQDSGAVAGKSGSQQNGATGKSFSNSPDRGQKFTFRDTNNSGNDRITNPNPGQAKPQPENSSGNPSDQKSPDQPPKPLPINAEQLTNLLRIAAVILMLVAGVAWYLWLQNRQEKIIKQKDRKFNQLPTIERIYWLMLKELRTSGSIKHSNETEWEFALSKTQKIHANELQYPGLLGKLITEISGDYVAWRYGRKAPNDTSLNHKFERFCELHGEFYAAGQAKHKAATSIIPQVKKTLHPVK
jgi:hypothetical protein